MGAGGGGTGVGEGVGGTGVGVGIAVGVGGIGVLVGVGSGIDVAVGGTGVGVSVGSTRVGTGVFVGGTGVSVGSGVGGTGVGVRVWNGSGVGSSSEVQAANPVEKTVTKTATTINPFIPRPRRNFFIADNNFQRWARTVKRCFQSRQPPSVESMDYNAIETKLNSLTHALSEPERALRACGHSAPYRGCVILNGA